VFPRRLDRLLSDRDAREVVLDRLDEAQDVLGDNLRDYRTPLSSGGDEALVVDRDGLQHLLGLALVSVVEFETAAHFHGWAECVRNH
jgi:hypothetical protein